MKVLGLIPARGGSKGIPQKNIKKLNGLPLIAYSIKQGQKSKLINRLIVSTDDHKIKKVAESFEAEVPFIRPDYLSNSTASSLDVILHAVDWVENQGEKYDAVCLLQPTSPFRPAGVIDKAIEKFQERKIDSLVSLRAVPDHFNPHWTFQTNRNGFLKKAMPGDLIGRRQDLPKYFHRDGAIYLLRIESLKKSGKLLGPEIEGYEINSPALINIDSHEDWEIAERYMSQILDPI